MVQTVQSQWRWRRCSLSTVPVAAQRRHIDKVGDVPAVSRSGSCSASSLTPGFNLDEPSQFYLVLVMMMVWGDDDDFFWNSKLRMRRKSWRRS